MLSLAEWIVLTLVDEGPTHGFAIAALTAEDGDVGRAWHVPRPIVYRSLDRLGTLDLVRVESTEAGRRGPQRSILTSTPDGAQAVGEWLERPVGHVREMRSELLVKLALRLRRDLPPGALVAAQRETVARVRAAIERQRDAETGFGRILLTWRYENALAAERFLDAIG
ncbi:helix-turn-helix transcriptional regulator [Dactylosporangium sp. NBC_01737]|uniref:PadR family transcriptional regulator n=1 Tax=Dactylosporangium sp. NBC_01737 TaxID=2975959 RepID=UPI002E0F3545|nr:helix-turn-helix transcriptional regulator [Dactylosporangium sp. NBC_01737]